MDKRITPELVVCANFSARLELLPGNWGDGQTCGCPQTILAVADEIDLFSHDIEESVEAWARAEYGHAYAEGFRNGFDRPWDEAYADIVDPRERDGFADGAACRKALEPTVYA